MADTSGSKPTKKAISKTTISRKDAEADAFFLSIGEGAIATDEYGNISRINRVALKILGYTTRDVMGKWFPEVIVAEDSEGNVIPNIQRPITEAFLTGKPVFSKIWYQKKDGSRVPVAQTVSPVITHGVPVGAVEVFRDITKEVELENTKDEFISIASHQLRTPATVVKQYLGMLIDGYVGELTENQLSVLRTALEYNEHELDTINDLLNIAQADADKLTLVRKEVDLVELVQDVVETQQREYSSKDMSLAFSSNTEALVCRIDPLHIRMVIENLLTNAYKYSQPKTKVSVELKASSKRVFILIKDHGVGIDARDIPKLFQKFTRIGNPLSGVGGSGLGLYWAKKLIDLHDGKISVDSELHSGTTFTIELPMEAI